MKYTHIMQLKNWINKNNSEDYVDHSEIQELRNVLGEVLENVNIASNIFKKSMRSPSIENIEEAKSLIDDISAYDEFKRILPDLEKIVKKTKGNESILNIIHTLEHARFSENQIREIKKLIEQGFASRDEFPEETNKEGLDNLLSNSIYNAKNPQEITLKVVREVLQNAVDATDPKQHPELEENPSFKPEIHIKLKKFGEYADIIVHDKGVGMNWDILSKKFFVTFDSGKKGDAGAAGGFGIAKALIQEKPKHGWSIDTRGIHSSRFHKNVHFGTRQGSEYVVPKSKISSDGTTLALYGLPRVEDYQIESLCEVYATNGRVKIFFNGDEHVTPRFLLDSPDVKSIDDNVDGLVDVISKEESDKQVAKGELSKVKEKLMEKISDVSLYTDKNTTIKFFVKKASSWTGKSYVMVNGQYQFDYELYNSKLDVICSITTTARPGSEEYPLDPGRSMVRGKVGEKINEVISQISDFSSKVSNDDLFKKGLTYIPVNKDQQPLTTMPSDEDMEKIRRIASAIRDALDSSISQTMDNTEKERAEEKGSEKEKEPEPDKQKEEETSNKVEDLVEKFKDIKGDTNAQEESVARKLFQKMIEEKSGRVTNKDIAKVVEGLMTPAVIMCQNNFIGSEYIEKNTEITADILILWKETLDLLVKTIAKHQRYRIMGEKKYIPGIIYSEEVLGLYMPARPESGRPYISVSINPISISAAINPKLFNEKVKGVKKNSEAFESIPSNTNDSYEDEDMADTRKDTPINRVSKFLFHIGLHELCHLLYPDGYGNENFHNNISYMEIICHDAFEKIRDLTKKHMKLLRTNSNKLLNAIAKAKRSKKNESFYYFVNESIKQKGLKTFSEWVTTKAR